MKFFRAIVLTGLLCSACSLPARTGPDLAGVRAEGPSRLLQIHIASWWSPRFSGLLGLRVHDAGLTYMLLDPTGITLLESQVSLAGDYTVLRAAGQLGDSGLPGFLASSLRKIYLIHPATEPCADTLLLRFCAEKTADNRFRKYVSTGPFTLWKADYGTAPDGRATVMFAEPWVGVTLTLSGIGRQQ